MPPHRPHGPSRRYASQAAAKVGGDIDTARRTVSASIAAVAARARVAPSTVHRVLRGDSGVHLDTICAVAAAVGLRISLKAYPAPGPSLRDRGQLRVVEYLIGRAHPSFKPAVELPVGDPFGRAADLVLFGPEEILHCEVESNLPDWQAAYRSAAVKRDALQAGHQRSVRLVIAVTDTRRNRELVAGGHVVTASTLPAGSRQILHSLRTGTPLGRDGILWVRSWRP